jgi:hypothetical protein
MMRNLSFALLLTCAAASAQEADGGTLASEIDAAAGASVGSNPVTRALQSLNPDISALLDVTGGIAGAPGYSLAGDDPDLGGSLDEHPAGFTVQEAEVGIQAVADPFFRADVFLTIPNLHRLEVEEAFATTTSLPFDLQLKAGIFRSALGRQNAQHLHLQDFTRRPLINEAYLGADGLRAPGVQLSWLVPTSFFLQWSAEAFSASPPEELGHLASFGGGRRTDLTYTTELKAFLPATESLSLYAGLNAAFGKTAGVMVGDVLERGGATTLLQGIDVYLKYKPANVAGGYFSLAWTTEFFLRHVLARDSGEETARDGGLYTQLVTQVDRRWFLGLRQDLLGLPSSQLVPHVSRTALSVTFAASEFARLRAYVERETQSEPSLAFFEGVPNWAGYLQLEVGIGAHGAHPF